MTIFNLTRNKIRNTSVKLFNPQKRDRSGLPLLIYFPGMDGTGKLLNTQIGDLIPHFNLRCLSISSNDMSNWEQLSRVTLSCLQAEVFEEHRDRVYLCGESFGGCLAMSVATAAPELFKGMVLVNPASSFNQQPILSWGIDLTPLVPEWLHRNSAVMLLPFLGALNRIKKSDRQALLEAMKFLPQEVVSWRLSMLQKFQMDRDRSSQFREPTLILASGSDRLLPSVAEAAKLVDLFPNSTVEILPNSGHACLLEAETKLADILAKHGFISR